MPKSSTPRLRPVTLNLTPAIYSRLRRQAAARTTSVSQLLRELLIQNLQVARDEGHDDAR